jgi:PAS domain S-box-containing protein
LRIAKLGNWELDLADLENLDGNRLHCSEEACRILGFRPGQPPPPSEFFFHPVHPDDLRQVKEVLKQAFRSKEPYEVEHRVMLPDGKQRVVRERAEFVLDSKGKPLQLRGVVMDVTDQQRADKPADAAAPKDGKPAARVAAPAKRPKAPRTVKKVRDEFAS